MWGGFELSPLVDCYWDISRERLFLAELLAEYSFLPPGSENLIDETNPRSARCSALLLRVSVPAVSRLLNVCAYGIVGLFKWMM